jgi:hypothetical protein
MLEKHRRSQARRLPPFEDRAGDVGGEIGQADDPGIVGSVQLLAPWLCSSSCTAGMTASGAQQKLMLEVRCFRFCPKLVIHRHADK